MAQLKTNSTAGGIEIVTLSDTQTLTNKTLSGDTGVGTTTPAGVLHTVLSAGHPAIFGGDTIATLGTVAISNADPSVLTKDATIDDGLAVGDAVVVNSGTNATVGTYIVASIIANTSVTLDRQAATGACADGSVTYVDDPIVIETSSGAGKPRIILPLQNDAATPTLAFGDGDSGFYQSQDNYITVSLDGVASYHMWSGSFYAETAGSYQLMNETTSDTNPVFSIRSDNDTGIGSSGLDQLSLIAGGVEGIRITENTTIKVDVNGSLRIDRMDVSTKTDNYVVTTADLGKSLRMNSADDKNFTLPSMGTTEDGARLIFIKQGAGKMTVTAVDTDTIDDSSATGTIHTETNYATITLEYVHGMTRWVIISANGTFTTT